MALINWLKRQFGIAAPADRHVDENLTLPMPPRSGDAQYPGDESLNFYLAIQSHQKWKAHLTQYVLGESHARMDVDTVCRDDRCALGLWLHHEACVPYAMFGLFSRLMDEHAEFHREAAEVVRHVRAGEADMALTSLTRGPCAHASRKVISTLTELHMSVDTALGWQQSHLLARHQMRAGAF